MNCAFSEALAIAQAAIQERIDTRYNVLEDVYEINEKLYEANEELRAANEELRAANEELRRILAPRKIRNIWDYLRKE
jgi:hypothetical protein|tara:strand:+ start:981 stop:1214 length:234 start_codon:yes stop_codon:yes gene_type:complete